MQTLARMREVCQRRGVRRIAAVATAAVREAENGKWFVRRVRKELDIPLRIIDAETEAALSYRSVAHHFRLAGERALVADIGGGSLELIGAVDGLVELHRLAAARRGPPHRAAPARRAVRAEGSRAAPGIRRGSSSSAASRVASGPRPRSSAAAARSPASAAWCRRGAGLLAGRLRPRRRRHRRRGGAAHRLAGQPDARGAAAGAGAQPGAGRHHPRRARGHGRAARPGPRAQHHGERVRACARDCCSRWPAPRRSAAPDPLRLFREFAERCQCDRKHVEQVRTLALQLFDQLGARARLRRPRSACCSRRPRCCTTSASS